MSLGEVYARLKFNSYIIYNRMEFTFVNTELYFNTKLLF